MRTDHKRRKESSQQLTLRNDWHRILLPSAVKPQFSVCSHRCHCAAPKAALQDFTLLSTLFQIKNIVAQILSIYSPPKDSVCIFHPNKRKDTFRRRRTPKGHVVKTVCTVCIIARGSLSPAHILCLHKMTQCGKDCINMCPASRC